MKQVGKIVLAGVIALMVTLTIVNPATFNMQGVTPAQANNSLTGTWGGGIASADLAVVCGGCGVTYQSGGGGGGAADPSIKYSVSRCGSSNCGGAAQDFIKAVRQECVNGYLTVNGLYQTGNPSAVRFVLNGLFPGSANAWGSFASNVAAAPSGNYSGFAIDGKNNRHSLSWSKCLMKNMVSGGHGGGKSISCGPINDGRPFNHPVGYAFISKDTAWNSPALTDEYYNTDKPVNETVIGATCLYLSPDTPPRKILVQNLACFWNIKYASFSSTSKGEILSGGRATARPPIVRVADNTKRPTVGKKGSVATITNCTSTVPYSAAVDLKDAPYAYYRLQATGLREDFSVFQWDSVWTGGTRMIAEYRSHGVKNLLASVHGIYVCHVNNGKYTQMSHGSLPNNVDFRYSTCSQWSCSVTNPPAINNTTADTKVMRDGELVPLRLPTLSVTGNGIRDTTTHQVGIISDTNTSYRLNVKSGSSPFRGTNQNATDQLFKMYKADGKTQEKFGNWERAPRANTEKFLSYYWSSDNGQTWQLNYAGRMNTAQFLVPVMDASDRGVYHAWREEANVNCNNRDSNKVTVIRSAGSS